MGITNYGLWIFFKTEEDAKKAAKELNSFGNRYGVLIMDKLKVLKGNSIRFYLSNLDILESITWRFDETKYVFIDRNKKKGWEIDNIVDYKINENEANATLQEIRK